MFVFALVPFLLSALVGGPVGFSSDFTGDEGIATQGVILQLLEAVHNFYNLSGLSISFQIGLSIL